MYHYDMVVELISPQVTTRLEKIVDCYDMYHHDMFVVLISPQVRVKKTCGILTMNFSLYCFYQLTIVGRWRRGDWRLFTLSLLC